MRSGRAIQITSLLLVAVGLAAATAASAVTIITGSATISENITDGVEATGVPGDTLLIEEGVTVTTTAIVLGAILLQTDGYIVTNQGSVSGAGFLTAGISFGEGLAAPDANGTLTNAVGASVTGSTGVNFSSTGAEVGVVTNEGTITGGFLAGVTIAGSASITNRGVDALIEGGAGGINAVLGSGEIIIQNELGARIVGTSGPGIDTDGESVHLTNAGSIEGNGSSVVKFTGEGEKYLSNESGGTISATGSAAGVLFEATTTEGGVVSLDNQGTISAEDASAVVFQSDGALVNGTLVNGGTLSNTSTADPVVDMGSVAGDSGATFTNSGTVTTAVASIAVRMGDGDDMVELQAGTSINGDIDGGAGDDAILLEGSGSFDQSFEGFETLWIGTTGAAADWTLSGASSVDDVAVLQGKLTLASGGLGFSVANMLTVADDAEFENRGALETGDGVVFGSSDDEFVNSGALGRVDGSVADVALDMGEGNDTVILQDTGSVEGIADGGLGDDVLRLVGTGGTLSGATFGVANLEHLQMQGTSWSLSGALSGFDDVTLSVGTFSLQDESSLGSGSVLVEPGAALATAAEANAELMAALENRGAVELVGTSAVLTLTGDYTQTSEGTLQIEVGPTASSMLLTDGQAGLDGALAVLPKGFQGTPVNQEFLQASGGRSGRFSEVSVSPILVALVCYDDDLQCPTYLGSIVPPAPVPGLGAVSVQIVKVGNYVDVATTRNQKAVAEAVDSMLAAGVDDPAITALYDLPTQASLDAALDQLSPEPLGATAQLAFENARWYTASLSDHLRDARLGVQVAERSAANGGVLASLGGGSGSLLRFTPALAAPAPSSESTPEREVGVWRPRAMGYAVLSDLGSGGGNTGYEAVTGVLGLGTERWARQDLLVGAEISAAYTDLESDRAGSHFDAVSGRLAVYGSYARGPWYVDLMASYAYHSYDATRRVRYGSGDTAVDAKADSDHGAHEVSDYLGVGMNFRAAGWDFGPEASVQYTALMEESYDEKSAGGVSLDMRDRMEDSLSSRVGVSISRPWQIDENNVVLPRLRVAWAHEWLDTSQDLEARFQVSPVGAFEVDSRSLPRDSVVARAGLQAALAEGLVVEVDYGVDAGRGDYLSQQLSVIFSGVF